MDQLDDRRADLDEVTRLVRRARRGNVACRSRAPRPCSRGAAPAHPRRSARERRGWRHRRHLHHLHHVRRVHDALQFVRRLRRAPVRMERGRHGRRRRQRALRARRAAAHVRKSLRVLFGAAARRQRPRGSENHAVGSVHGVHALKAVHADEFYPCGAGGRQSAGAKKKTATPRISI